MKKRIFLALPCALLFSSTTCFGTLNTKKMGQIEHFLEKNSKKKLEDNVYSIKNIVVQGNKFVRTTLILNSIPYKQGDLFDSAKSVDALNNLYALSHFRQIQLEAEKVGEKEIDLYVVVQEKKLLEELKIQGNKALSTRKIKEQLSLDKLTMIDEETLRKIGLAIKKLYKEENRHFVNVETNLIENKESLDKAIAQITIKEGVSSSVTRVEFKGNNKIPDRTLRTKISTRENWLLSFMDGAGTYKEEDLEIDKHRIAYLYRDQGYLMAKVTKVDVSFSENKRDVRVTFHIDEGEQFIIRSLKAPGDEIFLEEEIMPLISLEVGKPYSQTKMMGTLNKLRNLWGKKGYIYADVYPQVKPDEQSNEVDITFHIDRGNKLYVNRIFITGNEITHDKVIRRQIDIVEGELITTQKLQGSQNGVGYLGYFKRDGVNWKIHRMSDSLADLEMNVAEDKTGQFVFQMAYGSDRYSPKRSLKGMISVEKRNLFGRGWDIGGNIQANRHRLKMIEGHFFDPHFLDSEVSAEFSGYKRWDEYDQWTNVRPSPVQKVFGASSRFGFRLPYIDKRLQLVLELGIEDIRNNNPQAVGQFKNLFEPIVKRTFQTGAFNWLGVDLIKDTRNHRVYPSQGYKVMLSTRAALPGLNDEFGFFKVEASASSYLPLIGTDSLVLATHVKGGRIDSFGGTNKHHKNWFIPYKELFHMGGQGTVRGFTWGGIGPAWLGRDPLGSKNAIQFNTELIFPLIPDYSMKAHFFYDCGAGWDTPKQDIASENKFLIKRDSFDLRHAIGFGINLLKPVPAKIDWGFKLDRKKHLGEAPSEFHLSMNYAW
ncbi:MAG: outer membrane protein assembly factor BamA [bacterium]